mgnify:CR=1 FL=1
MIAPALSPWFLAVTLGLSLISYTSYVGMRGIHVQVRDLDMTCLLLSVSRSRRLRTPYEDNGLDDVQCAYLPYIHAAAHSINLPYVCLHVRNVTMYVRAARRLRRGTYKLTLLLCPKKPELRPALWPFHAIQCTSGSPLFATGQVRVARKVFCFAAHVILISPSQTCLGRARVLYGGL